MLELKDFFHLPQVDALIEQIVADGPGMVIVAGLDPRPLAAPAGGGGFLPSGRSTIFRILVRHMLAAHSRARAVVVAESKDAVGRAAMRQAAAATSVLIDVRSTVMTGGV